MLNQRDYVWLELNKELEQYQQPLQSIINSPLPIFAIEFMLIDNIVIEAEVEYHDGTIITLDNQSMFKIAELLDDYIIT